MDFVTDERTETTINELVSGERPLALELPGDDERLEVVVIVARDTHHGIFEARGNQFLYFGRFHLTLSLGYFPGGAQFNLNVWGIPTRRLDCV